MSVNLIANPSFETDILVNWWNRIVGTITATLSWGVNPLTGLRSARLDCAAANGSLANFSSCAQGLLSLSASPPLVKVQPGKRYRLIVRWMGTAGIDQMGNIGLFILIESWAVNWTNYQALGRVTLTPSPMGYSEIQLEFDVPLDRDRVWLNLAINTVGYVDFDDIELVEVAVTPTRYLTYQSTPINVPLTFDGQQLQPGQTAPVADGATITISVPPEVTV